MRTKTTKLSSTFTFENYQDTYGARAIPLCAIDPNGKVYIYTTLNEFKTKADWQIVSLVMPESDEEKNAQSNNEEGSNH